MYTPTNTAVACGDDMEQHQLTGLGTAFGGACAFIVAMGIGRFAFTAILPGMMDAHGFGEDVAGIMAAWNYAGYLAGVLLMRGATGQRRYGLFIAFILASIVTTACMGFAASPAVLHGIRFIAGVASGACFVLCSSIVLDVLTALNRPVLAGIFYSGVGTGIAIGALATGPLIAVGGSQTAWFGLAAICVPLAVVSIFFLRSAKVGLSPAQDAPRTRPTHPVSHRLHG